MMTEVKQLAVNEDYINEFINVNSYQLTASDVPVHFWPALALKLKKQVYDAGNYFRMWQCVNGTEDPEDKELCWRVTVIHPDGVKFKDPNNIFLIDHAWTYQAAEARSSLQECEGLLQRMCNLFDIQTDNADQESLILKVLDVMWLYNGTYTITNKDGKQSLPLWYVMDEFGSRIQHDGDANFRVVPFFYQPDNCCYSLLFPIKDVKEEEEVTRNYVETPPVDDLTRDAQMQPWFPVDLSQIEILLEEPPLDFFNGYKMEENVPEILREAPLPVDRAVKVYTDYKYVKEYLSDKRFEAVDDEEQADIIWISTHFTNYKKLSETPGKRVNQFPNEQCVTVKDLLTIISRRPCRNSKVESVCGVSLPVWSLSTFCLKRELPQFVACFQRRAKLGLDNTWIVKPWNLGRGLDITVTNNLNEILRLPATGPKIAQKYLHSPVLFYREDINARVKFDLRFIVILLKVKPLQIGIYKNFWIRFANKEFSLDNFYDYEQHFTVNNYNDAFLLQMFCQDFIKKFEAQNPSQSWKDVEQKIYSMVKECFEAATMYEDSRAIMNNPQSRACYGVDLMLDWEIDVNGDVEYVQPKLLEVNFNPDNKRACEYYPNFFNDLFAVMFLDEDRDSIERL